MLQESVIPAAQFSSLFPLPPLIPFGFDVNLPVHYRRRHPSSDSRRAAALTASRLLPVAALTASLIMAGASATSASAAAAGIATIKVTLERDTIRADGRSTTLISVQVRDDNGHFVPDGTRVRFSTTAGQLETSIKETQNGIAVVTLTAANLSGVAVVTINLEGGLQAAQTNTQITFSEDAVTAETGTNWVKISGAYAAYLSDYHLIQANGKRGKSQAKLEYRGLTIFADSFQLDVQSNQLQAVGDVKISQGKGNDLSFNALRYNIAQALGTGERLDEGRSIPALLTGASGHIIASDVPAGSPPLDRSAWSLKDVSDSNVAIVARSIQLNPNNQVQFRKASFYVDGSKTLSLPLHVMDLQQGQLFREQIIGLGPTGVSVDLPLYYNMSPQGIGTLHVRRGAQVGTSAYSVRPGWRADLEQSYSGKNGMEGTVQVNNVAQGDWGVQLRHAQRFGNTTNGSLFVDFPNNRDLYVTSQMSRMFKTFSVNAVGYASRSPGYDDPLAGGKDDPGGILRGQLYAQTNPRVFLKQRKLLYSLSVGTSRQSFYGFKASTQGILTNNNANLRLNTTPIAIGPQLSLTQSVSIGQATLGGSAVDRHVYTGPGSGMTLLGSTVVSRKFGTLGLGSLTYDYAQTPLGLGFSNGYGTAIGRHRAGLNLNLGDESKLSLSVNASQGLDVPTTTLFSNVLFGLGGPWRGRISFTTTRYGGYGYQDSEFALVRRIAGRDVALYYSTTARRIRLDFAGVRF